MRSFYTVLLFLCPFQDTFGQKSVPRFDTSVKYVPSVDIDSKSNFPESCWQELADSISAFSKTGIVPAFLLDPCFDWEGHTYCWPNFHAPTSVRWKALSLVKQRQSLVQLIKNHSRVLKAKCSKVWTAKGYPGDLTPPMNEYSTYALILCRLAQLTR